MRLNKIAQLIFVGYASLMLGACSTTGTGDTASDVQGAQSAGLGENEGFGDDTGTAPQNLAAKRVYYFKFDSSVVTPESRQAIIANADYLIAHPQTRITLEGHTDPRGSREYNVGLGERRANSVLEILKSRGVNPGQIHVVSYGAERLAAPGHTETDYQLDRRAVIVYS